jgi:O-antigen ligase
MFSPLKNIQDFFTGNDTSAPLQGTLPNIVRAIITFFVLVSPNMYNYFVPEVAGDVRWYALGLTVLFGGAILALHYYNAGVDKLTVYKSPLSLYFAGFLALMTAASLFWTESFYRTLFFGTNFVCYIGLFYLVYMLRSKTWFMSLISVLAISVIFNSILGICHFLTITDDTIRQYISFWPKPIINYFQFSAPPAGTFANKNLAASFLVVALPLMFWLFTVAKTKTETVISTTALALGGLFFMYTRTRGSWLSFGVALICFAVWVIIHRKAILPTLKASLGFGKVLTLASVLLFIIAGAQLQSGLKGYHSVGESIGEQVSSVATLEYGDVGTRMAYNINGVEMVKDRPFLGTGYAGFFTYYPMYHAAKVETPPHGYKKEARPQRMHNDIAQMFVELGIFAGLAWLALFLFPLFAAWKIMRSGASDGEKVFTSILLLSIGGMTINSIGDFPLQMPTGAMVLWLMWAMMTGLYVMNCMPERKELCSFKTHKMSFAIIAALLAGSGLFYAEKMYQRNAGAWNLKMSMAMIKFGRIDERTLSEIENAYSTYPYNPRTIEHLALIYTVYYMRNQPDNMPYEKILAALDIQALEDPYGAGNLINRSAVHLQRAQQLRRLGDKVRADKHIDKAEKDFKTLLEVLPMHQDTYSTGGLVYLLKGKLHIANELYNRALEIAPHDKISKQGLNAVRVRALQTATPISGLKGATVSLPMDMMPKQPLASEQKKK